MKIKDVDTHKCMYCDSRIINYISSVICNDCVNLVDIGSTILPLIYTVQVLYVKDKQILRHRNWGWFQTFAEAEYVTLNNITDIFEGNYYNYALINECPPGITVRYNDTWYKATYKKKSNNPKVTKCKKPINKRLVIRLDI